MAFVDNFFSVMTNPAAPSVMPVKPVSTGTTVLASLVSEATAAIEKQRLADAAAAAEKQRLADEAAKVAQQAAIDASVKQALADAASRQSGLVVAPIQAAESAPVVLNNAAVIPMAEEWGITIPSIDLTVRRIRR